MPLPKKRKAGSQLKRKVKIRKIAAFFIFAYNILLKHSRILLPFITRSEISGDNVL